MKQQMSDPFYAISDTSRREILMLLSHDSLTINALADNFDISRPAVSKHIKVLETAGFITIQNIGRQRYCILKQAGFNQLQEWINYFDEFWETKLHKLEKTLNEKSNN